MVFLRVNLKLITNQFRQQVYISNQGSTDRYSGSRLDGQNFRKFLTFDLKNSAEWDFCWMGPRVPGSGFSPGYIGCPITLKITHSCFIIISSSILSSMQESLCSYHFHITSFIQENTCFRQLNVSNWYFEMGNGQIFVAWIKFLELFDLSNNFLYKLKR